MQEHLLVNIFSLTARTSFSSRGKHAIIGKGKLHTKKNNHRNKPCTICWKIIPSNSMSGHMATCQAEMVSCDLCAYQTPRMDFMKRHKRITHETRDERKERLRLRNSNCSESQSSKPSPNFTPVKRIVFKHLLSTIAE